MRARNVASSTMRDPQLGEVWSALCKHQRAVLPSSHRVAPGRGRPRRATSTRTPHRPQPLRISRPPSGARDAPFASLLQSSAHRRRRPCSQTDVSTLVVQWGRFLPGQPRIPRWRSRMHEVVYGPVWPRSRPHAGCPSQTTPAQTEPFCLLAGREQVVDFMRAQAAVILRGQVVQVGHIPHQAGVDKLGHGFFPQPIDVHGLREMKCTAANLGRAGACWDNSRAVDVVHSDGSPRLGKTNHCHLQMLLHPQS